MARDRLAGLKRDRLGRADAITQHLELAWWPTAPAQGLVLVRVLYAG